MKPKNKIARPAWVDSFDDNDDDSVKVEEKCKILNNEKKRKVKIGLCRLCEWTGTTGEKD